MLFSAFFPCSNRNMKYSEDLPEYNLLITKVSVPNFFFFIINFPTGGLPHLFHSVVFPYWVIPNHIQTCCYVSDVHGRGKQISNNNKKTCLDPTLFIPFPSFLSFSNNILWKNCINDSQSFLLLSFQPLPIKLLSLSLH